MGEGYLSVAKEIIQNSTTDSISSGSFKRYLTKPDAGGGMPVWSELELL